MYPHHYVSTPIFPRLAMMCVLQEGPNALNLVAPDCGSFSLVSRATSQRSPINPLGRQGLPFVFRGNGTISRCAGLDKKRFRSLVVLTCVFSNVIIYNPDRLVLLLLLMVACHGIFCLEQPRGSKDVLPRHPRFEWLCNEILYVSILWFRVTPWILETIILNDFRIFWVDICFDFWGWNLAKNPWVTELLFFLRPQTQILSLNIYLYSLLPCYSI